jgi:hypothetical protein
VIDASFWNRLRVKALLDKYLEGFIEYAMQLQQPYSLTDEQLKGVIIMAVTAVNPKKLSELSKLWKKAVPAEQFSPIPEGDYVGDLKEMILGESKNGRLQVVSTYEIADGDLSGKTLKRFDGVDAIESMGYFKRHCEVIGLDLPEDLNLWQETLDEFVAANVDLYDITVKSSKGEKDKEGNQKTYTNIYVNGISEYTKATGEETTEEEAVEEEAVAEEEVEQEVQLTTRKIAKPVAKPVAKVAAKPVAVAPKKLAVRR